MIRVNKQQREFLEEIGILKTSNRKGYYTGMTVTNKQAKTKEKSYYVEDSMIAYISPEWFRNVLSEYHAKEFIESQIKSAKLYLQRYEKNKVKNML